MARNEYMAGMLRVLILSELAKGEGYGYGMASSIADGSGGKLRVRPESLYPVLHRMQGEGLVQQRWMEAENGRPRKARKVYSITAKGKKSWGTAREDFIKQNLGALKILGVNATVSS
jgi:PadR family transcriptional regulator, regulatory protein PadR